MAQGKALGECKGDVRHYKGLGGAKSLGARELPLGMRLLEGNSITGKVKSNELNRPEHYMCLSACTVYSRICQGCGKGHVLLERVPRSRPTLQRHWIRTASCLHQHSPKKATPRRP